MPILIVPYTLGTDLSAPGAAAVGGAAYVVRRRRYVAWMVSCLALLVAAC